MGDNNHFNASWEHCATCRHCGGERHIGFINGSVRWSRCGSPRCPRPSGAMRGGLRHLREICRRLIALW